MQELEASIKNMEGKIHDAEAAFDELRKLQDLISTKSARRSALFEEQERQYAALNEENEGLMTMVD